MSAQRLTPVRAAVDHLLLGVADLEDGIAWVERITGVTAVLGGSHPGVGTRNALLSLAGRQYLEIIAPDPLQTVYDFRIDLRTLTEPRLIAWAALTTDIQALANTARGSGHQLLGPRAGARARPNGTTLKWQTLGVANEFGLQAVEPFPFFIEWRADSVHPSQDSPTGCELLSFEIEHPGAAGLMGVLGTFGIGAKVHQSREVRLVAALQTPKGHLELS
jgi:Glyoxalase-like domain